MDEVKNTTTAPQTNGAAQGTVKYRCEVTCYDNKLLYHAEEIYEFPAGTKPFKAEYFTKI